MYIKNCAVLAIATGLAAAKPIAKPEDLPAYRRSAPVTPVKRGNLDVFGNGFSNNFDIFNEIQGFNDQQVVIQAQEQNFQFIDNGFQQQIVQEATNVLIVQEQNNGFNNKFNDLSRKASFRNSFPDQETTVLVVKEMNLFIQDGFGNEIQQDVFVQSALVANRGFGNAQTLMVFEQTAINQKSVFDAFGGVGGFGGVGAQTAGVFGTGVNEAFPTATNDLQFFGQKPTWSSVVDDPAQTVAAAWQAELEDLNNVDNQQLNNDANQAAAEQEKAALEAQQQDDQNQEGEDNQDVEDQAQEGEDQAQEGEDQAQEGEEQVAEGEKH